MARWNWTTPVWYLLILEFKSMKLNIILLPQLLCAIHKVSGSLHLRRLWLSAHKTLVYGIRASQGSVATRLRCGWIFFYSSHHVTIIVPFIHMYTFQSSNTASVRCLTFMFVRCRLIPGAVSAKLVASCWHWRSRSYWDAPWYWSAAVCSVKPASDDR